MLISIAYRYTRRTTLRTNSGVPKYVKAPILRRAYQESCQIWDTTVFPQRVPPEPAGLLPDGTEPVMGDGIGVVKWLRRVKFARPLHGSAANEESPRAAKMRLVKPFNRGFQ